MLLLKILYNLAQEVGGWCVHGTSDRRAYVFELVVVVMVVVVTVVVVIVVVVAVVFEVCD